MTQSAPFRQLIAWLPFALLATGLAVTVHGLATTGVLHHSAWARDGLVRFGIFALAAIALGGCVFIFLRRRRRGAAIVVMALLLIAGSGVVPVAAALYLFLSCLCLGDLVAGKAWRGRLEPLTAALLSILTGFALLIAVIGAAVHFPVNIPAAYAVVLAVPILLSRRALIWYFQRCTAWLTPDRGGETATFWLGFLVIFIVAVHLVNVALPERYHDALAMHLMVPGVVATHGMWHFDFTQYVWAVMPMGGDWAYTAAYLLGGEAAAKLILLGFFLVILGLVFAELRRFCNMPSSLLILALFASTPVAFITTATLFVENVWAAFLFAGFVVIVRGWKDMENSDVVAVALLLGAAAFTKALAVFAILPLGIVLIAVLIRQRGILGALPPVGLAVFIGGAIALPPYIYAFIVTGNPVFPFFNAIFDSPYFPIDANFENPHYIGKFTWDMIYQMTFRSSQFLEGGDGAFGFHYLLLTTTGIVAGILRRSPTIILASLVSIIYIVGVSVNTQYIRYLYPIFPIMTLLCGAAFAWLARAAPTWEQFPLVIASPVLMLNLALMPSGGWILGGFNIDAVVFEEARTTLMRQQVPQRRLVDIVNAASGPAARVAIFGTPVGAELQGTAIYANWYNTAFNTGLWQSTSSSEILAVLVQHGVTHVIIEEGRFHARQPLLSNVLAEHATEIARSGTAVLYELNEDVRFAQELIVNGAFSEGLDAWTTSHGVVSRADAPGVILESGAQISQTIAIPIEPGRIYLYTAVVQCHHQGSFLRLQVNWRAEDGELFSVWLVPRYCGRSGEVTFQERLTAPNGAVGATLYAVAGGPAQIEVRHISLRR